jgi:hypothetical protein
MKGNKDVSDANIHNKKEKDVLNFQTSLQAYSKKYSKLHTSTIHNY